VLTLLTGAFAAQAFSFALYPVLTRLYDPADFGLFGVFTAIVITLAVGVNGGYEAAVMLPEDEQDSIRLVRISLLIALAVSVLTTLVLFLLNGPLFSLLKVSELDSVWFWIPLSLMAEGVLQPVRTALNRLKEYRVLSAGRVVQSLLSGLLMLGLGLAGFGFEGLIFGFLAGQLGAVVVNGGKYLLWRRQHPQDFAMGELKANMRRYRDFPTYAMWGTWFNSFSRQLPFFLLPLFFGKEVAGFFNLATKVLLTPVGLVGRSVGEVFYQKAAAIRKAGAGSLGELTRKTAGNLALTGIAPALILMAIGPWLFGFVFGAEWVIAGHYARWMAPWIFLLLIISPLSFLVDVERRLEIFLLYSFVLFAVRAATLGMGGAWLSADMTVLAFAVGSAAVVAWHLWFLLRIGGVVGKQS
jgi:O-antigen/teichoic acid export membrane protein